MKILKEQIVFTVSIGMLVVSLLVLLRQARIYEQAYHSLSSLISNDSVRVEVEE